MISVKKSIVDGEVFIPSSKSQTIRALLIACFAKGKSIIKKPLISKDTESAIKLIQKFGATVNIENDKIIVDGGNLTQEDITVDCENSGTTMYLSMTLACSLGVKVTYKGDEQLNKRPIGALLKSLEDLGAKVGKENNKIPNYPPFTIQGPLKGGETTISCPTSQYLSSLLLGAPLAFNSCVINVPLLYEKPYVEITRWWLRKQNIQFIAKRNFEQVKCIGEQKYTNFTETISGDFSSASFFFCMAAITNSSVTVCNLREADPQGDKQILSILRHMGCKIKWHKNKVTVTGCKELKPGNFDLNNCPDTLPVLCATSVFVKGRTMLYNVPQARIKETDRIKVMRKNLQKLGVWVKELDDGLIIEGGLSIINNKVKGYKDHRVIMAMITLGLGFDGDLIIDDEKAISITYPNFIEDTNRITNGAIKIL